MRPVRLSPALTVLVAASTVAWLGCGGGSDLTEPKVGTLEITASTSGPEPDADGYSVSIDGGTAEVLGVNGTLRRTGVIAGSHTVELSGLAANCTLAGAAHRDVSVAADAVAAAAFAITCAPTTGTIQITTTAGTPADPDGYRLLLDGVEAQPIGLSATLSLPGISPGAHTVGLSGVDANCAVDGEHPRNVTVVAGQTATVSIAVTCTTPPPPPGTLTVTTATTGAEPDPDGYLLTVDAGPSQPIGLAATVTLPDLAAAAHTVELLGVAANCTVTGGAQRSVEVTSGGTAEVAFAIVCAPTTGGLTVTVTGLPGGVNAAVTVGGPGGYTTQVTATRTLTNLVPGAYTVAGVEVTSGSNRYTTSAVGQSATVVAGATAVVTVAYALVAPPTLNLRVDGWQVTQSTQNAAGNVPLVSGRDAYLRVFVLANDANNATAGVRVRLYHAGVLSLTITIPSPDASAPLVRNEGQLNSTWNTRIPGSQVTSGLAVLADVDPDNQIPEVNETDNSFPVSGTPRAVEVRTAAPLAVRFVPIKQKSSGLQGSVTTATAPRFLKPTLRMYPLPGADADLHAPYTTVTGNELQSADGNGAWLTVLSEVNALRVAEGSARTYYGVLRLGYFSGIAGLGFIGLPAAIGYDDEFDGGRIMAHELGHTWSRQHSPCGGALNVDPAYPYPGGLIGVYGMDVVDEVLKDRALPDIMGYCGSPWISDYTYQAVFNYRATATATATAAAAAGEQPCLLVWGHIVDGRPVLEPAFEIVTRPSLPPRSGPYSVQGLGTDGTALFDLSFDAAQVADDPHGSRHFAFAIPLRDAARLGELRLVGPGVAAAAVRPPVPPSAARVPAAVAARRVAGGLALHWDASTHPMVMVRDPDTGEILSFARGGDVEIATGKAELDLSVSDGVGSERMRVRGR
jgi:hypothetical protein